MTNNEEISSLFSMLHDGAISAWQGDKNLLTLTIECDYLAQRINKAYNKFYIDLIQIEKLELEPWSNPIENALRIKTQFEDIFKEELEIITANIIDEIVVISCNQYDTSIDYCGGNLSIACKEIKLYDQEKNELTLNQLELLCKDYWKRK